MRTTKITALSIPIDLLKEIDGNIKKLPKKFRNRSHAVSYYLKIGIREDY